MVMPPKTNLLKALMVHGMVLVAGLAAFAGGVQAKSNKASKSAVQGGNLLDKPTFGEKLKAKGATHQSLKPASWGRSRQQKLQNGPAQDFMVGN